MLKTHVLVIATGTIKDSLKYSPRLPFFHEKKCFTTKIKYIYLLVFHRAFSREGRKVA